MSEYIHVFPKPCLERSVGKFVHDRQLEFEDITLWPLELTLAPGLREHSGFEMS